MGSTPPTFSSDQAFSQLSAMQKRIEGIDSELEHQYRLATLGTLAAGVAHEINNLLTPAMALAQLASLRPDDQELQRKALGRASLAMKSVADLVSSLVDFSVPGEANAAATVSDAVERAIECLPGDPQRHNITIRTSIPPGLRAQIPPLALQQVLLNLLLNACRALWEHRGSPSKAGEILISTTCAADDEITIRVADNGPGIPAQLAQRIFDPFVRGSSSSVGAGLGLAMCRATIEAAGGTIQLRPGSEPGATFEIRLARAQPAEIGQAG